VTGQGGFDEVRGAAGRVVSLANRTAGLVAGLSASVTRNASTARTQALKAKEDALHAAREETGRRATEAAAAATALAQRLAGGVLSGSWASELTATAPDVLAVADHVRVGTLRLALAPDHVVQVPAVVPWLDHGNIVVRAARTHEGQATPLIQSILLRSMLGTGAGQLTLSSFDPELSPTLAMFSPLRQSRDDLVNTALSDCPEFAELLEQLARDVRRITDMYRGERTTLGSFRRATGQPIESFEVVTILNYPSGITPETNAKLATLMRTGPACGIGFIVQHDPDVPVPDRVDTSAVLREARLLDIVGRSVQGFAGFDVRFEVLPGSAIVDEAMGRLAIRVRNAAAPRIDFASLQPTEYWRESSADRLVATIGRTGHERIDIVLGDETDQKHNVLVTGAVGQGKSNLLMALIHSWAMNYSPRELQMYLLDFKDGVTLYPLAKHSGDASWLPHARVLGLESDRPYGVAVLEHLVGEFERRASIIKPYGDNISRFRTQRPDAPMPRIVVVIDEFQVLFEQDDALTDQAMLALERLARKGRAYGIHLVLASQTLSGITALIAKKDGIFSQFPIRLALRNSAVESRAVLSATNTEAARLRYRGEVVVNRDFGEVEGNSRGVVALADPAQLSRIRSRLVEMDAAAHVPSVFDGGRLPVYRPEAAPTAASGPRLLLGTSIAVDPAPVWVPFGADPGRHFSLLGTGKEQPGTASQPAVTLAVAALSLADTATPARAEFWICDVLAEDDVDRGAIDTLEEQLRARGYVVRRADRNDTPALIHEATEEIAARRFGQAPTALFVVVFGVDRIPQITVTNFAAGGVCTLDDIHAIWEEGVVFGIHLLGWWNNAKNYYNHTVNRGKSGLVDLMALLRVPGDAVSDYFGPFVSWASPDLRILVRDVAIGPEPSVLLPMTWEGASADAGTEVC